MKQDWPTYDWKRLRPEEQLLVLSMLKGGWRSVWHNDDSSVMLLHERQQRTVFRLIDQRCWWAGGLHFKSLHDALSSKRGWLKSKRKVPADIEIKLLIVWLCFWSAAFATYGIIAWLS
jgi:hypothetical protein